MNIAVLASGNGSNFEAIAQAVKRGYIKSDIKLLITDREKAFVRKRAQRFKIPDVFINPKVFRSRTSFNKAMLALLRKEKIDLIALAGYMRVLSPHLVKPFRNKIMNIHPALLPSFKGVDAIKRAYNYGCKVTGVTVHFVDERVDHGPIILQEAIRISKKDTLKKLEKRIHALEHRLYPKVIKLYVEKRLRVKNRNVKIV